MPTPEEDNPCGNTTSPSSAPEQSGGRRTPASGASDRRASGAGSGETANEAEASASSGAEGAGASGGGVGGGLGVQPTAHSKTIQREARTTARL